MTENQGCARGPVTRSQVHSHRNYSSCAVSSQQFSARGERDEGWRDQRSHALRGPGVDLGGFCPPRLYCLWETPPQCSGLGVGGAGPVELTPAATPNTELGWDPARPSSALHPSATVSTQANKTDLGHVVGPSGEWSSHSGGIISYVGHIWAEGPEANRRPSLPSGADWETETKREDILMRSYECLPGSTGYSSPQNAF